MVFSIPDPSNSNQVIPITISEIYIFWNLFSVRCYSCKFIPIPDPKQLRQNLSVVSPELHYISTPLVTCSYSPTVRYAEKSGRYYNLFLLGIY